MKKIRMRGSGQLPLWNKWFRLMKLTFLFMMIGLMQISASVYSQTAKLTLNMRNARVIDVLEQIEKQSEFRFAYSAEMIDLERKVTVSINEKNIDETLDALFAGTGVKHVTRDRHIMLYPKELDTQNDIDQLQQKTVSGKVTDESNLPLPGVTVLIKGTTNGTVTNSNGNYSITNIPENATLVFSFVGMQTQEIVVGNQNLLNVTMVIDAVNIEEVVAVGYGTANKRDLTGSIVKLSGKEVANKPNSNPMASLQGKVTGLTVVNNGYPGSNPDVRIRGTVSLNQTSPLYVVDGIFSDNIFFVNTADIESIEVLKDPSSLAIFGVRGANGVIIVTTKKGKEGKVVVNLNSSFGVKSITDVPQMTDRSGFITLYDEQRQNQRLPAYTKYDLYSANTDWIRLLENENPIISASNISISSGTEKNKFYMGVGYNIEQGLIKYEDYNKITLSVSDELKVSNAFKTGFDISGYRASLPQTKSFSNALKAPPIVEAYNSEQGLFNRLPEGLGGNDVGNPLQRVEENKYTAISNEYNFSGSIFAELTIKKVTLRANLYYNNYQKDYRSYTPLSISYNMETSRADTTNAITSVSQDKYSVAKFQQDYLITYKNQFGEHGFTALGGFTTYYESSSGLGGNVKQYIDGDPIPNEKRWWYLNVFPYGDPESRFAYSSQSEKATVSLLFRALYNYKGKYLLNSSFRRDGSSAISPNHRYQNFWAAGGAWILTEENFMSSNKLFNNIKIKASVGQLGNQYTGLNYPYYPNYQNGTTAVFGDNIVPAYVLAYRNDPDLKWETVNAYEGGADFDALNSKIHVETNYYNRKTKDLLTIVNDGSENFYTNAGSVRSSGIELLATWRNGTAKGINYSLSANITTINSKVLEVWQPGYVYTSGSTGQSRTEVGYPIAYFYGYEVEGIDEKGNLKFKNTDDDPEINSSDRTMIGNPTPKFTYGFSGNVNYKGFDASIDFQGVYGNEVWRNWGNEGAGYNVYNFRVARLGRWTGEGTSNWEPQENTTVAKNSENSSYMIEDGSYLRIRNIQLGYTLNPLILSKVHISSMRVYINSQNPKTWKHNSGFTPEAGGGALAFGIDGGGYPVPAITSFGLNLTF